MLACYTNTVIGPIKAEWLSYRLELLWVAGPISYYFLGVATMLRELLHYGISPDTHHKLKSDKISFALKLTLLLLIDQSVYYLHKARQWHCTWPTRGPPGSCRPQGDSMLAPWTLLSGILCYKPHPTCFHGCPIIGQILNPHSFAGQCLMSCQYD